MFSHEKLTVYQDAVSIQRRVMRDVSSWSPREAVVDQFLRASESVALNIATSTSLRSRGVKLKMLDYALGSTLETAACCDIARIKELFALSEVESLKADLASVANRIVGLRRSWEGRQIGESEESYAPSDALPSKPLFWHEKLDVYKVSLEFVKWFSEASQNNKVCSRHYRLIDAPACSLVLNIAEGNGRFAEIDHRRFLNMAKTAAVKAAASVDLVYGQVDEMGHEIVEGKNLLERCVSMLVRMAETLDGGSRRTRVDKVDDEVYD